MESLAYTLDEVAAVTRLSKSEIKRRIRAGEIIVAKVGRRTVVRRERVDQFLAAHEVATSELADRTPGRRWHPSRGESS